MSSTPVASTSRSGSPAISSSTKVGPSSLAQGKKATAAAPKPVNIFSNDGSFLTRFKKDKTLDLVEIEKSKAEEAAARAKALADRFKNRGKRPAAAAGLEPTPSNVLSSKGLGSRTSTEEDGKGYKRAKMSEYEREVAKLSQGDGLREEGVGMNAMLK